MGEGLQMKMLENGKANCLNKGRAKGMLL